MEAYGSVSHLPSPGSTAATSWQHLLDFLKLQSQSEVGPCGTTPKRVHSHWLQGEAGAHGAAVRK